MDRSEIFAAVSESAVELLKVDASQVTEEATFGDDLGADSLDLTELVMALEDRFDIEVPEDDLEDVRTIGDAVNLVHAKVTAGAGA